MAHREKDVTDSSASGPVDTEQQLTLAGAGKSTSMADEGTVIRGSGVTCDRQQSANSSTSSVLTNSSASPSSSLTSISASSPTSSSNTNFSQYATVSNASSSCQQSLGPQLIAQTVASHCCSQVDSQEVASAGDERDAPGASSSPNDDVRLSKQDEAPQPLADEMDSPGSASNRCNVRLERSNSCSQAETTSTASACGLLLQESATLADLACVASSASQDNLARPTAALVTVLNPNLERNSTGHLSVSSDIAQGQQESTSQLQPKQQQQQQQQQSSSRFFSSKLNTGSLWSLLSAGSSSGSQNPANDSVEAQSQADSSSTTTKAAPVEDSNKQLDNSLGGFFSRVQFPSRQRLPALSSRTASQQVDSVAMPPPLTTSKLQEGGNSQANLKRVRFNVKYIGSALLHKNFTLPMLEWIARDIKRQTTKGAQSTSHRQFTMPRRDIVLEIQAFQLKGISCKDGHCIFVHPMHCVSKYAQLQHDQTCFSYLIRDSKDSPYFCHVFQAKSTSKVHEIFSAIREATTTRTAWQPGNHNKPLTSESLSLQSPAVDPSSGQQLHEPLQTLAASSTKLKPTVLETKNMMGILSGSSEQHDGQLNKPMSFNQTGQTDPSRGAQFENSYQFEVMFVKKVKLQCRRVPASFVDDALETLKSFEVLKGGDTKGQIKSLGKRIISASVDERQEYDQDHCQPTPTVQSTAIRGPIEEEQRRGSSVSLHKPEDSKQSLSSGGGGGGVGGDEERESRSCQQSPTKGAPFEVNADGCWPASEADKEEKKKKHQSLDCLKNIDCTIKSAKSGNAPTYTNDFSPYNTITCSDLNERIAKIPVVSSSVSLDHETRQKLAKQVRETIMATAANIKKDVYASGDKLDSSSSSKALDSLSCTATSSVPLIDDDQLVDTSRPEPSADGYDSNRLFEQRRSSAAAGSLQTNQQFVPSSSNNFDLFRRASGRQVVKNRTMLLLIGKDELCTISIDKHQMLFSKSFSLIVHCLQGHNNKDHFGLICRDSGKINPQAESYAGFIFKCQSDKVVREIMGALKQVIYSSHHNYHGYNSPYNPLNSSALVAASQYQPAGKTQKVGQLSPKAERQSRQQPAPVAGQEAQPSPGGQQQSSLAAKRGFASTNIEIGEAARLSRSSLSQQQSVETPNTGGKASASIGQMKFNQQPAKNLIKSMFCDQCPLYWYHRLCCDIESLPADASKAIILRRIDSSLSEREQDELYSRFSEFTIDSTDEHNEIFMSLLRQLCERQQLKHNQNLAHQSALAKNSSLVRQQSASLTPAANRHCSSQRNASDLTTSSSSRLCDGTSSHQRSGSSGGSLPFGIGQASAANQSIADASSVAIDNLKKAKNSISVSIENMLKRRSSMKDEQSGQDEADSQSSLLFRSGSFRSSSRETHGGQQAQTNSDSAQLKRSQSTSDQAESNYSWRESLSKTLNNDLATPLASLFRRRSSTFGSNENTVQHVESNVGSSTECLTRDQNNAGSTSGSCLHSPARQPASPSILESRFMLAGQTGRASPSSVLSSSFWKKSIFDKIKQPVEETASKAADDSVQTTDRAVSPATKQETPKRSRAELRLLWRKAIMEQITLLKMDKQNQRLQQNTVECDIQRLKLNYKDVPYSRETIFQWNRLLKQDPRKKVEFVEVARMVRSGVPKQRRGEIWMFLMNQYQLRHGTSFQPADSEFQGDANQTYRDLLSQLSVQQHEIFVDIGRTFPTHPYYSQYLSIGQLSLFNLLKAYSLLDQEVGYCQGLSFVAGILLLHVDGEDEAFELMRHLLFNFGLRKQYLPSMNALHLQLYQITRLLRDHEYDLFNHFDHYDISPSLYAAPWFLTLFASQFPLGFVARLLDLIFLIGIEAIFRVSLKLLAFHRANIIDCKSLESSMEYMRFNLVKIDDRNLVKIFDESMSLDLRNKLIEYEIEYTFYCAEDKARTYSSSSANEYTSVAKPKNELSQDPDSLVEANTESTSVVADATATVIIQHLLANNHLKSLRSNYSY